MRKTLCPFQIAEQFFEMRRIERGLEQLIDYK